MGVGFLVPAFLAGLAVIAVPIILHLLNRQREGVIRFPSLMFLERIPYREIRRQTIRHPLLLALRCLGLILLAAAFARPFFDRDRAAGLAAGNARELVVLLDRSYSMGHGDRWPRALAAARAELATLSAADQATIVAFDERAASAAGPAGDAASLGAGLDTLRPLGRRTRLAPALAAAREILAGSARPQRDVVIVSDLQRAAWDGRDEGRLPANVGVRVVDLSDSSAANTLVAGVELARQWEGDRQRVTVVARVVNRGSEAVRARRVTLELQGRTVETRTIDLAPRGAAQVRFSAVAVPEGLVRAAVRITPDALPADDTWHFILSRDQALRVLVVTGAGAPARRTLYLRQALALGDTPPFAVDVRDTRALGADIIDAYDIVVLNDAPFPAGAAGRRIIERVRAGMGLVAVLGERSAPASWPAGALELLPARVEALADRSAQQGGRIGTVERSHPIFAPFRAARSGDFTAARFLRHRPLVPRDSARALVHLDDGSVLLAEGMAGQGTVLAWGSTLDAYWGDFALQPVFLPFVHGLVRHAAGYAPEPIARTVGQLVRVAGDPSGDSIASAAARPRNRAVAAIVSPSGARQRRSADSPATLELAEAGFYELITETGAAARIVAANVDRAESDLASWNPAELAATLVSRDSLAGAVAATPSAEERERKQAVWWFLLVAAAAVLLLEAALANRLSWRGRTATDAIEPKQEAA